MAERSRVEIGWLYRKLARHSLFQSLVSHLGIEDVPVQVGWGLRPSGRAAIRAAARNDSRLLLLEDAFVRSIKPGAGGPVYGLLADSKGIHYDAAGGSDLLDALESGKLHGWMRSGPGGHEVGSLMNRFRRIGASKYNWFPGEFRDAALPGEGGILVVDQTRGDRSIHHGGMSGDGFDRMLRAAFEECEGKPIYLRAHPDHLYRLKKTCVSKELLGDSRLQLLSPEMSPAQCFSFCQTVMVGSSLMGMEALIHGRKVVCFGWPFYAGRGLTDDRGTADVVGRRSPSELAVLFRAAYLDYCHYFDPDTGEVCGLGRILDHLELQKEMFGKNRGLGITVGFSPWQRRIVPEYLRSPAGRVVHVKRFADVAEVSDHDNARILCWGRALEVPAELEERIARVEDGFLRSKGLGAAFNFPYSWVIDERGIYFDAGCPSDLERILHGPFSSEELEEAAELVGVLREMRLTKYNLVESPVAIDRTSVGHRKVILVPGQVEADASIRFGSPAVRTNLTLLQRVRENEPDAYLVFKAHPDLVAGARHGLVLPPGITEACDLAVTHGNVLDWLDLCDEVHTMTSTVGFEALIRRVPVVTYGMPFYAGWGLTTDRLECPRRKRRLVLEELVCGALMKYPRYLNPATGEFTTALKVARVLASQAAAGDKRSWQLKTVSKLKKAWVELARG